MLALDLGFATHAHFTSTFRRVFGAAPSDVRGREWRELRRRELRRRDRRDAIDAA